MRDPTWLAMARTFVSGIGCSKLMIAGFMQNQEEDGSVGGLERKQTILIIVLLR
jgi:hypothetical protein